MEQHSVPQQISAFNFKLFGNLTSKQFITLAIPLGLAALIFFSSLPTVIRLPLSFVIGIFAFTIALVPVGGKSADQWALAFIKALTSPTQRIWIKEKEIPRFLNIVITPAQVEKIPDEFKQMSRERLLAYLGSLPKESESALDIKEQIAVADIDFSYQQPQSPQTPGPGTPQIVRFRESPVEIESPKPLRIKDREPDQKNQGPVVKPRQTTVLTPKEKPRETSLPENKEAGDLPPSVIWPNSSTFGGNYNYQISMETGQTFGPVFSTHSQVPHAKVALHARPYIVHGLEKRLTMPASSTASQRVAASPVPTVKLASETNFVIDNIIPVRTWDNRIKFLHGIGRTRARKLHFAPPPDFDLSKLPIRGEKRFELSNELKHFFKIEDDTPPVILPEEISKPEPPDTPKHKIQKTYRVLPQKTVRAPKDAQLQPAKKTPTTQKQVPTFTPQFGKSQGKKPQTPVVSSAQIIPLTSTPNIISGLVTDAVNSTISGAVLVIRDGHGIPIRALKTNKLGQFLSATPLPKGDYAIETEIEGYQFKTIKLKVEDKVIVPIHIQADSGPVTN
ncbi:hypothetical protein A3A60_03045 [Candidatus Curtissbacteria bacterium RIFCSPLOWO2_01_FULL_42_26]|uniref:Carboxypeptidase regulatory-like domain-containing protein n=1 Tax=Candidatus Curtissbacteria bacterium RIFCSPLOWO2_01_FULL_42_26 TaxID=1797729 RepID=A0A1F5I274_9BACT|nr:MAG: hypothetical protein A3A60_03045 [Candidatus Curtissbacteria bacterium RIFCSPLOWO2_01_FULL_42_26]